MELPSQPVDNFEKILEMVANNKPELEEDDDDSYYNMDGDEEQQAERIQSLMDAVFQARQTPSEDGNEQNDIDDTPKVRQLRSELREASLDLLKLEVTPVADRGSQFVKRLKELTERKKFLENRISKLIKDRRNQAEYRKRKAGSEPKRPRGRPRLEEKKRNLQDVMQKPQVMEGINKAGDADANLEKPRVYSVVYHSNNDDARLGRGSISPKVPLANDQNLPSTSSRIQVREESVPPEDKTPQHGPTVLEYLKAQGVGQDHYKYRYSRIDEVSLMLRSVTTLSAIYIPDKEVRDAFSTLRPFFMRHRPESLPLLSQLILDANAIFQDQQPAKSDLASDGSRSNAD